MMTDLHQGDAAWYTLTIDGRQWVRVSAVAATLIATARQPVRLMNAVTRLVPADITPDAEGAA